MSEVSLQLSGNAEWWVFQDLPRKLLVKAGFRVGKWFIQRFERNLDRYLASLTGFFELSLLFSPEHAAKELKDTRPKLDALHSVFSDNLAKLQKTGPPLEFEVSALDKLQRVIHLIEQVKHRLLLISLLDLAKLSDMQQPLRQEVLAINALRHQKILEAHPELQAEIDAESDEWLQADLQPIID